LPTFFNGFSHNWSPTVVTGDGEACNRAVLVDGRQTLNKMEMVDGGKAAVRVVTGVSLDSLLTFLEDKGQTI